METDLAVMGEAWRIPEVEDEMWSVEFGDGKHWFRWGRAECSLCKQERVFSVHDIEFAARIAVGAGWRMSRTGPRCPRCVADGRGEAP